VILSPNSRSVILRKISSVPVGFDQKLSLSDREVVLYLLDLRSMDASQAKWQHLLSEDEQQRVARFHFERDRRSYGVTRGVLRSLLADYVESSPEKLSFRYSNRGKPALERPSASCGLAFNVSHSGDFALLGFTRRKEIGVDIEKIRGDFDSAAIARRFFSAQEQTQLAGLPADQQHHAFFRCWTRKEAFIKALGEGLSHPLRQFDVSLDSSVEVSLSTRPDAKEADRWWLQAVDTAPYYAAAFAVSEF
jgi:4'-phosphopantetheinyl transferase